MCTFCIYPVLCCINYIALVKFCLVQNVEKVIDIVQRDQQFELAIVITAWSEIPAVWHQQLYVISSLPACIKYASIIIPAKAFARDYVITGVGLSVCLFVCYHDN